MKQARTRTNTKAKAKRKAKREFVNDCGYIILIDGTKARHQHRVVWERHNGPIPAGYHIHHRDGVRTNNRIGNLQLLPASEHMRLHALARIDAIRERARITANKLKRDSKGRFLPMSR